MPKFCKFPQSLDSLANQAGYNVSKTMDGQYKVTKKGTAARVGIYKTEIEAKNAIRTLFEQSKKDLDASSTIPTKGGVPLTINPARPGEPLDLTPARRFIASMQTGVLRGITGFKSYVQGLETLGYGKPFTSIYENTQRGYRRVNEEMSRIARKGLKGSTFDKALNDYGRRVVQLPKDQRELVVLRNEALTREELRTPGRFLSEGMNDNDIAAALVFEKLGNADRIPEFVRVNALVDNFLSNREKTRNILIPRLEAAASRGHAPDALIEKANQLKASAGAEDTVDGVLKVMGYSADEIAGINFTRDLVNSKEVAFNIPAVYRYANAPSLKKGFKSGKDQFASERGMSPEAIALSDEWSKLIREAYDTQGYNYEAVIEGHMPVFRQFMDAGIFPGMEGKFPDLKKYIGVLDGLPEGKELLTRRVISGHINPYELNPTATASKHIRNIFDRIHLDPEIKEARKVLKELGNMFPDKKFQGPITEYLHELQGIPQESWISDVIRFTGQSLGMKLDDRVVERWVYTMNALTSSATIPFRPALILRNWYQNTLYLSRVGPEAWWQGQKSAMGWEGTGVSSKARLDAVQRAVRAGAIDPNVLPIHLGNESLDEAALVLGRAGPELAKLGYNVKDLFDWGFTLYRTPDDFGRVAAFEAGRFKVNRHLDDYLKGKIKYDKFKELAKIKTYNEAVEAEFDRFMLVEKDYQKAANWIGKHLADDTFFLYGGANHPIGWGGVGGKLFGQFGTFPVQYANYVVQGLTKGTAKDRWEFLATHSAVNMGIIAAGSELFDTDLSSWAFLPSLRYSGGPYADAAINMIQVWRGSDAERMIATRNLEMMLPGWDHKSIFLPGSFFVEDVVESFGEEDLISALSRGAGFREMRPGQETLVDKAFKWLDY